MKQFFATIMIIIVIGACNNGNADSQSVGDSLDVDPTTAQPITTEPDTIGPERSDSTNLNQ